MVSNLGAASTFNIFGAITLFHLLIFWLVNNYAKKNRKYDNYEELAKETEEEDIDENKCEKEKPENEDVTAANNW